MNFRRDDHPHEFLSAYLDGEVEPEARSAIETHLSGCDSCRALLQDFRSMAVAAARETPPPVPADLRLRVRRALDAQVAPRGAFFGWSLGPYRLGLAAAAGLVLVIGLWALRQGPPAPGVPTEPRPTSSDVAHEADRAASETVSAPAPLAPTGQATPMEQSGRVGLSDDLSRKRSEAISPAPAAAAPEAKEDAPKVSPSNDAEDREESAGKVSAPAAAARGPAARRQPAPPEEKLMDLRSASASAGSPGRRLLVEYPAFTVSVFEDGLIALSAKEYSCAARLHDPPVDPDVAALFALASSSGGEARGSPGEASPGAPVVRLLDQQAAAGTETSTGGRVLAGMAREIGSRLSTILRDRYLVLMEARCGPPPLDVRSP